MLNQHDAQSRGFARADEVKALLAAARQVSPEAPSELNRLLDCAMGLLPAHSSDLAEASLRPGRASWPVAHLTMSYAPRPSTSRTPTASNWSQPEQQSATRAACEGSVRFGRFLLSPGTRRLLRDGTPVVLGSRAFDLLHVLLQSRGVVVGKAEIMRRVWPAMTVEESNLRFQMACLRKALGADRDLVKTVCGRGYLLVDDNGI